MLLSSLRQFQEEEACPQEHPDGSVPVHDNYYAGRQTGL
jgi:hypothetical protein